MQDSDLYTVNKYKSADAARPADSAHWYVMRDLRRPNARVMAWQQLGEQGCEVFTPLHWITHTVRGHQQRRQQPVIPDLLFLRGTRGELDPIVTSMPTLQYRYRIGRQSDPMTVRDADMQQFILAVRSTEQVRYYRPDEITPDMFGRLIRIIGGPLDGCEGHLLSLRGSRTRRLIVNLPGILALTVEVNPDYIQVIG